MRGVVKTLGILAVFVTTFCASAARSQNDIQPGAIELSASGSFTGVGEVVNSSLGLGVQGYGKIASLLLGAGGYVAYSHVSDLDRVDITAIADGYFKLGNGDAYGFLGLAMGVRQEWVGSFSVASYPLGFNAGIKGLIGPRAGFNVAYRFRWLAADPVNESVEHQVVFGLSVFFRNIPNEEGEE